MCQEFNKLARLASLTFRFSAGILMAVLSKTQPATHAGALSLGEPFPGWSGCILPTKVKDFTAAVIHDP